MGKKPVEKSVPKMPKFWSLSSPKEADYEAGVVKASRHKGKNCAYIKSVGSKPEPSGILTQFCSVDQYRGHRLRMSAWVKSELSKGSGLVWLRIDGEKWRYNCSELGYFDNMHRRPINGCTDWQQYFLVVDAPGSSSSMSFGVMHTGKGTLWLDDISFEIVSEDVPLTGVPPGPSNLNFEEVE